MYWCISDKRYFSEEETQGSARRDYGLWGGAEETENL